ncbi:MAG: hypothetical protein JSU63_06610 [Phycisphaerales bacterium]|nr:MAG: hypothetical protein JSU63_06610 [Phycisphaerales bacterium]
MKRHITVLSVFLTVPLLSVTSLAQDSGGFRFVDCNENGIDDPDDIAGVSPDVDENGVPDECELPPGLPSVWRHQAPKNRYLSIDPSVLGDLEVALKVELVEMYRCSEDLRRTCRADHDEDCPGVCDNDPNKTCISGGTCGEGTCIETTPCLQHPAVGLTWWVDDPRQEPTGCRPAGMCTDEDWFAWLSHTPVARAWNDFGAADSSLLHVTDCGITPVAMYEVSFCLPPSFDTCGPPLTIGTIEKPTFNYADVVGPVDPVTFEFAPPDGFLSVTDVSGYLLTASNWRDATGYPKPQAHWTWVSLTGWSEPLYRPYMFLCVCQLQQILLGVEGRPFSFSGNNADPGDCP